MAVFSSFLRRCRLQDGCLCPQFVGRDRDHLSIAPDVDGQAFASMFDITSSTAALSAISARCSNGRLRTFAGGFVMAPVVRNQCIVKPSIHYMNAAPFLKGNDNRRGA